MSASNTKFFQLLRDRRSSQQAGNMNTLESALIDIWEKHFHSFENDPPYKKQYEDVLSTLTLSGEWKTDEEWRISTFMQKEIKVLHDQKNTNYQVTVSCDRQVLSCVSQSFERAYFQMELYSSLIVSAIYSVGPSWAKDTPFTTPGNSS